MAVRGCRVGTEVDEEQGGRAQQNSRALCLYTRHWETHSNTFTHSHTDTVHTSACFCPLPHRLALASRRAAPSPVQSWVSKLIDPLYSSSPDLWDRASCSATLPVDSTEFSGPSFTNPGIPTDQRMQRTNNTYQWTKGSSESTLR